MDLFLRELIHIVAKDAGLTYFVDTMILGSVLISILLLIRPWIRWLPRAGMYLLWIAVGIRLLIPENVFNFFPQEVKDQVVSVTEQMKVHNIDEQFQLKELDKLGGRENGYRLSRQTQSEQYVPMTSLYSSEAVPDEVSHREASLSAEQVVDVLRSVWVLGLLFLVVYMLEAFLWVRLRLCDARLVDENVYTHPLVNNSFVVGWSNPRIYLSEQAGAEDRRYILYHERVHIRRRDHIVKPLLFLLCSIFWINPLMWVAYRCMVEDMEVSCDEAVLHRFGEHRKKEYSTLLLQMSAVRSGYRRQYASFCTGEVPKRIRHVLHYREPGKLRCIAGIVLTCFAIGGILSVPGAETVGGRTRIAKSVYVEQSYMYSDEEELSPALRQQMKEKAQKGKQQSGMRYVGDGEGFYVMLAQNSKGSCELVVCRQDTAQEEYRISIGGYVGEPDAGEPSYNLQAGVTDDRIYFVCDQGIFETVYGSREVVKMVSATADNVYYLSDDQSEYYDIVRGEYDDYYVAVGQNGRQMICHYGIRKVRVNRG